MRELDPETQCEIIEESRRSRNPYGGALAKLMMMSAAFGGMNMFDDIFTPSFHTKRSSSGKDGTYYIKLTRAEQKLPYETKQDIRKVRSHLKTMGEISEYQTVVRYKFR